MYSLSIAFGDVPTPWRLLFRSKERAETFRDMHKNFPNGDVVGMDDFGQEISVKGSSIHGLMLENLDESMLAYVEMMLHQAKCQAKAQTRANSDPVLTAGRRGPAVLTPMGNGMA